MQAKLGVVAIAASVDVNRLSQRLLIRIEESRPPLHLKTVGIFILSFGTGLLATLTTHHGDSTRKRLGTGLAATVKSSPDLYT